MKYVIKLRSKYTGEETWLGCQYPSHEEAVAYAEKEVCNDCDSYSIILVQDGRIWIDKETGFRDKDFVSYKFRKKTTKGKIK